MPATRPTLIASLLAVSILSGCASVQKPEQSGFLSDYSRLKELNENQLAYRSGKVVQYDTFIVDPVKLLAEPDGGQVNFREDELEELVDYFEERLKDELTRDDGYTLVDEPGAGVARIRIALTDARSSIGLLNLAIYTKITGAGIGGAAFEAEIVDSESGEQLAAYMRWGGGSRVLRAGLTRAGDAKIVIDDWTTQLRERFDQARGRTGN